MIFSETDDIRAHHSFGLSFLMDLEDSLLWI